MSRLDPDPTTSTKVDPTETVPDDPAPTDALKDAFSHIGELRAYAIHYISAKADQVRLSIRKAGIYAVLGIIGLMAATALVMIDPAAARLMLALLRDGARFNPSWGGYALTFAILAVLIVFDRAAPRGRGVFRFVAAVFALNFVLMHVVPGTQAWQSFAHGWAALGG